MVAFVAALGSQLHARGKQLAVSVPPMGVVATTTGCTTGLESSRTSTSCASWRTTTRGVLRDRLAARCPGREGCCVRRQRLTAIKGPAWYPTYGRDWVKGTSGSGCPSTAQKVYDSKNIGTAISGVPESSWKRDGASQERYFNYTVTYGACRVSRSAGCQMPQQSTLAHESPASMGSMELRRGPSAGSSRASGRRFERSPGHCLSPRRMAARPGSQRQGVEEVREEGPQGHDQGGVSPARAGVRIKLQVKRAASGRPSTRSRPQDRVATRPP